MHENGESVKFILKTYPKLETILLARPSMAQTLEWRRKNHVLSLAPMYQGWYLLVLTLRAVTHHQLYNTIQMKNDKRHEAGLVFTKINIMSYHDMKKT